MSKSRKKKVDIAYIQEQLTSMVTDLLSGKPPETMEVSIKLHLPARMANIVKHVSEVTGASFEETVAKMASEGIQLKLKNLTEEKIPEARKMQKEVEQVLPNGQLPDLPKGMEGLAQKLGGLQALMGQLQQMQGLMNAGNDGDSGEDS